MKFELQGSVFTVDARGADLVSKQLMDQDTFTFVDNSGAQITLDCADRESKLVKSVVMALCIHKAADCSGHRACSLAQTLVTFRAMSIRQLRLAILAACTAQSAEFWVIYANSILAETIDPTDLQQTIIHTNSTERN